MATDTCRHPRIESLSFEPKVERGRWVNYETIRCLVCGATQRRKSGDDEHGLSYTDTVTPWE